MRHLTLTLRRGYNDGCRCDDCRRALFFFFFYHYFSFFVNRSLNVIVNVLIVFFHRIIYCSFSTSFVFIERVTIYIHFIAFFSY